VRVYSVGLGGIGMTRLSDQYRQARERVDAGRLGDLRRGFIYTYIVLAAGVWLAAFAVLLLLARRTSRPIRQLTAGLSELAAGNLDARIEPAGSDEVGQAIHAFNRTAGELQQNRDRLVYLTQLASWQALARKMGHELKNSLTPIRLTMEEILARHDEKEAAQIVVDEIESLERRVRAFSEFAAEPPVEPASLDINGLVEERIALLQSAHPEVLYERRGTTGTLQAYADEDLVKGILTNLLENAADAAGPGGRILAATAPLNGKVAIEVHDSGPGLSQEARRTLFQPTISFKKRGMGLGLSIARKSALLSGGDILVIPGELGGAGFRVLLPCLPSGS
jgi:nitrogen fixation/metabolism regulation signal transduction histidine kinase